MRKAQRVKPQRKFPNAQNRRDETTRRFGEAKTVARDEGCMNLKRKSARKRTGGAGCDKLSKALEKAVGGQKIIKIPWGGKS